MSSLVVLRPAGPPCRRTMKRVLEAGVAATALVLVAPIMLMAALAVLFSGPGAVFGRVLQPLADGRIVRRTEFRTYPAFDPEAYDALLGHPGRGYTAIGAALRTTRISRLPVLLDVAAGRVRLGDAWRACL